MDKHVVYQGNSPPLEFAAKRLGDVLAKLNKPLFVELYAGSTEKWSCDAEPQGYVLYIRERHIIVVGADEAGAMYGGLDVAEHFANGGRVDNLQQGVKNPFLAHRGIKLNIPLDARTPSYTDGGDSAQLNLADMWDIGFWRGYFDRMAQNKYNALSFWSLSPFPSLVRTPGFEDVALDDVMQATISPRGTLRAWEFYTSLQAESLVTVKKITMDGKIDFWRRVMALAHDRCIKIYLFTWNIYTYGTEHTNYGIADSPDNQITRDYIRASVREMVETYPLLAGIGVTAGENMRREWLTDVKSDIAWTMDTYGRGVMEALDSRPEREFTFIHRAHMCSPAQMEDVFVDYPYPLDFSFKYSQAHMHSSTKPTFGDDFFAEIQQNRRSWLELRDDDFYMLRWGDAQFAREYLQNVPAVAKGFYHGSDGIVRARDYTCRTDYGRYFFDRHRLDFAIWGRLSYDITLPDESFQKLMSGWFGEYGHMLYKASCHASRAIPILQQSYWNDYDFQWYPEACCGYNEEQDRLYFHDLNMFVSGRVQPGSGYLSVAQYCEGEKNGTKPDGTTPVEAAYNIRCECRKTIQLLSEIPILTDEAQSLREDILAMALLGIYYASKLESAVALGLWRTLQDNIHRETAVAKAEEARDYWVNYSSAMAIKYRPHRLSRLRHVVSPELFDNAAELDIMIAKGHA